MISAPEELRGARSIPQWLKREKDVIKVESSVAELSMKLEIPDEERARKKFLFIVSFRAARAEGPTRHYRLRATMPERTRPSEDRENEARKTK